jgi:hypothetical protein
MPAIWSSVSLLGAALVRGLEIADEPAERVDVLGDDGVEVFCAS